MLVFCANGPLHICAQMVPGLPSPDKAHAAQGGESFDVWCPAPVIARGTLLISWTRLPRDMRVNPNFLVPHKKVVLPVPPL